MKKPSQILDTGHDDPTDLTRELERVRGHHNCVRLHEPVGYVTPHDEHTGQAIRSAKHANTDSTKPSNNDAPSTETKR